MITPSDTAGQGGDAGPQAIENLRQLAGLSFDDVPQWLRRVVYGVRYVELGDPTGGQLWVTRHGWPYLPHLDPARWYLEQQYSRQGQRMSQGTGAVFRVTSPGDAGRSIDLVVKFSRVAQEVLLRVASSFPVDVPAHIVANAIFNDPFEEFSLLEDLRTSSQGPEQLRIRTKRPLAIYSPGRLFQAWQLGRTPDRFRPHARRLESDQARRPSDWAAVDLAIQRQYILLFHWVRGSDAQTLCDQGVITPADTETLVQRVMSDLAAKGFHVPDTKPNHMILRRRRGGEPLRRAGRLVYALVDFELLRRSDELGATRQVR